VATDIASLVDRAMDAQRRLEARGLSDEARVIEQLLKELASVRPQTAKPFYTTTEAAQLVGVTGQTIKNWIARGILKGYRLGGRIVIPRAALDAYRSMAEAAQAIEPLPDREEIVGEIRAGRRRFIWPEQRRERAE
jgi:excisionase family DNA binding protein